MELGAELRAARSRAGLSLVEMARRTHFTKPFLCQVETGRRTVLPAVHRAYEDVLGIALEVANPVRVAHEWLLVDSPATTHTRAGRRVRKGLAVELETRVAWLRRLDDVTGGADLAPLVLNELADVRDLCRTASYRDPVGRRLLVVLGELSQLAGWVTADAGRCDEAQRLYLSGLSVARDAEDPVLAAQLLSTLAYQMSNVGNRRDALLVARSAARGASGATPLVRALLLERVAWAAARMADRALTEQTLDVVDDVYEERSEDGDEPEWVYWLDRREIDVMAGRCWIALGQPQRAEPLLSRALATDDSGHAREMALYLTWLAEGYVQSGNHDAARETLVRARQAALGVASVRLEERLRQVAQSTGQPPGQRCPARVGSPLCESCWRTGRSGRGGVPWPGWRSVGTGCCRERRHAWSTRRSAPSCAAMRARTWSA
ncbi:helix-turn-helix domain-containing protein [Streptoalloteichus hindustanus]|uniref:Helix-turn-helix domain-containing protein n=1 Tax=Streptoalloteichus hindustanus TaxID=2017 RepID=A0A1M4YQ90_STRHI|nr:helix-turn-helix transcriptional regulator [Streptoalloteichus hindustanus]SHF07672.1 Helix-turn-helix domain-containing protein [Streptoalloteichus hindustanus]